MENRVVVTGLSAITPIGVGLEEYWEGLITGRNGIGRLTRFDPTEFRSQMAAEVNGFEPEIWIDRKSINRMDRFTQFAVSTSDMALADAGLDTFDFDGNRAGVIIGSGIGGSQTIEDGKVSLIEKGPKSLTPFLVSKFLVNMAACMVSIRNGLKGPLSAPSMACSTGANAIAEAFRILQRGDADIMLAGSSEACLTPMAFGGFCATRSMSVRNDLPERASRPFDMNRDGFVMGEGAGIAVLECLEHAVERDVRIYAELVGYGNTADAFHYTAPEPDGDGMKRAMRTAIKDAGIDPSEITYINAHGTSTILNDKTESAAILKVFKEHAISLKVSSVKSMIGHLLAAAGAVEFVSTAMSIHTGVIPPTINFEEPDPACPLDYVTGGAEVFNPGFAASNSFGFGGGNSCLILKRYEQ